MYSYGVTEKKHRAAANSAKESAGRAAAEGGAAKGQRPRAIVQKKPVLGGSGQVVQLLQAEYEFTAARFTRNLTNEHRGVYLFTFGGEQVVVKYDASANEQGLTGLARQAGLNAPGMRALTGTELSALAEIRAVTQRDGRGVVMEYLGGEQLELLRPDQPGQVFTADLLRQIGRSYAFQLLTGSADRWPMPVNVGPATMTAGNSRNVMVDTGGGQPAIRDFDFTPGVTGDDYAASLRLHFRDMLQQANGGGLVQGVVNMIAHDYNAHYTIPEADRSQIVAGITEVMDTVDRLNVADSGLGDNYATRIRAVRDVYREELQAQQQQAQQAAQAAGEKCDCCYITTACVEAMGLPDDCEELTLLRRFRDTYLAQKKNGGQLIDLYYRYSPEIVAAIRRRDDEEDILKRLYGVIRSCVDAIRRQDYEFTYRTYCKMVIELKDEFIPEYQIGIPAY